MAIRSFEEQTLVIAKSAYIDETALVIGDVTIGEHSSLWPMVVARGDVNRIVIGAYTNIQDGSILHVTHDGPFSPGGIGRGKDGVKTERLPEDPPRPRCPPRRRGIRDLGQ